MAGESSLADRMGSPARPRPLSGHEAGAQCFGGWLDASGRFYHAPYLHHVRVAAVLRATGDGPADPWDMARTSWAMVKAHGEVLALPGRLTQPQLDTLADMLLAAPAGRWRSDLLASLRQLREVELCP